MFLTVLSSQPPKAFAHPAASGRPTTAATMATAAATQAKTLRHLDLRGRRPAADDQVAARAAATVAAALADGGQTRGENSDAGAFLVLWVVSSVSVSLPLADPAVGFRAGVRCDVALAGPLLADPAAGPLSCWC